MVSGRRYRAMGVKGTMEKEATKQAHKAEYGQSNRMCCTKAEFHRHDIHSLTYLSFFSSSAFCTLEVYATKI